MAPREARPTAPPRRGRWRQWRTPVGLDPPACGPTRWPGAVPGAGPWPPPPARRRGAGPAAATRATAPGGAATARPGPGRRRRDPTNGGRQRGCAGQRRASQEVAWRVPAATISTARAVAAGSVAARPQPGASRWRGGGAPVDGQGFRRDRAAAPRRGNRGTCNDWADRCAVGRGGSSRGCVGSPPGCGLP